MEKGPQEPAAAESQRLAYRPAELAELVGVSPKASYRAIEHGELPAAQVAKGARLLIPAAETQAWLQTNPVEGELTRPRMRSRRERRGGRLRPFSAVLAEPEPGRARRLGASPKLDGTSGMSR